MQIKISKVLLFGLCIFLLAAFSACRSSSKLGCPAGFGQADVPSTSAIAFQKNSNPNF